MADEEMRAVPIGVTGELYIGGAGVGRGYVGRADLTAERFVPDGWSGREGARVYRTGDLGRYREDGKLEYLGRQDDQVKVRGYRIELGEIEAVMREQEGVKEAVVVAEERGEERRLVGYVVAEEWKEKEWREGLKKRLPEYMVPGVWVRLEKLPLTANGKVDRKALPKAEVSGEREYVAPRNEMEQLLAEIWGEVLGVERVGSTDNFFELGGHSLLATQVMSRVREVFGVEVALREVFERPSVGELAEEIEKELKGGAGISVAKVTKVGRERELPLSFAQQRLWFLEQLEPGNTAYNIGTGVRLEGELEVKVLREVVKEIVRRHEVLRTRFEEKEEGVVQVIGEGEDVEVGMVDLEEMGKEEREEEVKRIGRKRMGWDSI